MDITETLGKIKTDLGEDAFNIISGKLTELNEESKNRRLENSELKGFKSNLIESFGLDSAKDLTTQIKGLFDSNKAEKESSLTENQKLALQISELSKKFEEKDKEARENAQKAILSRRDNELLNALTTSNIDPKLMPFIKDSLEKKINISDNGFTFSDGQNNYNSISEGVSKFVEANPNLQVINNSGGSGEQNLNNQNKKSNVISRDKFGANLEAIARGEVTVNGE